MKPRIQVTITLEERSPEDIYKLIMREEFSQAIASMIRNELILSGINLADIKKISKYFDGQRPSTTASNA